MFDLNKSNQINKIFVLITSEKIELNVKQINKSIMKINTKKTLNNLIF